MYIGPLHKLRAKFLALNKTLVETPAVAYFTLRNCTTIVTYK